MAHPSRVRTFHRHLNKSHQSRTSLAINEQVVSKEWNQLLLAQFNKVSGNMQISDLCLRHIDQFSIFTNIFPSGCYKLCCNDNKSPIIVFCQDLKLQMGQFFSQKCFCSEIQSPKHAFFKDTPFHFPLVSLNKYLKDMPDFHLALWILPSYLSLSTVLVSSNILACQNQITID